MDPKDNRSSDTGTTWIVIVCVNIGLARERVVAVFPESIYGEGPNGAQGYALAEARRWGSPARVTVDLWPPLCHGVAFEIPPDIARQVAEATGA